MSLKNRIARTLSQFTSRRELSRRQRRPLRLESFEPRYLFAADGGFVRPDLALSDVKADDYSAIVFVGGWGASQYQYGFEGTYHNSARTTTDDVIVDGNIITAENFDSA